MDKLTPYQVRVLALAAQGLNDEAIARRLQSGHIAVRTNMSRIYRNLGLATEDGCNLRVSAVLWYQQQAGKRT